MGDPVEGAKALIELTDSRHLKNSFVAGHTGQGGEIHGVPVHVDRHRAVFEVYDPDTVLRTSEVLGDFTLVLQDQTLYSGRAVLTSLLHTGLALVCEASLDEGWFDASLSNPRSEVSELGSGFREFLRDWQKLYTVRPEFKVIVADLQTFLLDLRLWLEQVQLRIRASPPKGGTRWREQEVMQRLDGPVVQAINSLHERFEELGDQIEDEARPAYQSLTRRQLHPLFLCSPFGYRSYHKPLGFAGDYEVVNMIMRCPYEGSSLFAQTMNLWLLRQYPSEAHRNRIRYLKDRLTEESLRCRREGRSVRVFSLGCGPAHEVQAYLGESGLCDRAEITLLDFNQETIDHAQKVLTKLKKEFGRETRFHFQKRSVVNILKEAVAPARDRVAREYDFIYCAGLFDYLPDRTCKQLLSILHRWLAPGGLLLGTNVHACRPFRHMLEFILDWHIIYRDPRQMLGLVPAEVASELCSIASETTGTNLFLEVRRPVTP